MTAENSRAADEAESGNSSRDGSGPSAPGTLTRWRPITRRTSRCSTASDPLRYAGSEAVRERAGQWLSWYEGPVGYDVRDLSVTAGDKAAFCHYLYRVTGTMTNGREVDIRVCPTVCFRKVEGA